MGATLWKVAPVIHVYTDGGARPTNPGPGGWAYVAIVGKAVLRKNSWWEANSTNNRMELTAAIEALKDLIEVGDEVEIISDSIYLVSGATEWIDRWVANRWRGSTNRPIKNVELWRALWSLKHEYKDRGLKLTFKHVKGHSGNHWNDTVDEMATEMAKFAAR